MKIVINIMKILSPFILGIGILWWMYRDTNWTMPMQMLHNMHWEWMLLSLAMGIVPLVIRALRWKLALHPLGESPRTRICTNAIFISYAVSLVIPRIGEVTRCGTLKKYSGVSFSKALGTVVAERVVDAVLLFLLAVVSLFLQLPEFLKFLRTTGVSPHRLLQRFTSTGYLVTFLCLAAGGIFLYFLLSKIALFRKGREKMIGFLAGLNSLRHLDRPFLYIIYSMGIWGAYYLHFYLAFFAFDCTSTIAPLPGLLIFCAGSFAVLVPTPNGAGPWHFAVKTMLVLYGVAEAPAVVFALLVHSLQTALVVAMGIEGWADLLFIKKTT